MIDEKQAIIALLERGKARFVSERDLVNDWRNYAETNDGQNLVDASLVFQHKNDRDICRLCILGGVLIENESQGQPARNSDIRNAMELLKIANKQLFPKANLYLIDKRTLEEVHQIYDAAIELARKSCHTGMFV